MLCQPRARAHSLATCSTIASANAPRDTPPNLSRTASRGIPLIIGPSSESRMKALKKAHTAIALAAAVALAGCGGNGSATGGAQRVVLALDFTPNAAHAPIYLAAHEGYDKREGIKLSIRAPGSGPDSLKLLTTGRADIGVLDINDLGLARERGEDLVGVGALVQRPLAALIAQPSIKRPRDLDGKRVGVSGLPSDPP